MPERPPVLLGSLPVRRSGRGFACGSPRELKRRLAVVGRLSVVSQAGGIDLSAVLDQRRQHLPLAEQRLQQPYVGRTRNHRDRLKHRL